MSDITISQLTSGSLTGDGVFDKLMEASQLRLEDAFRKGHISASDYSNVLVQSMATAMQQSIAYLLGEQQADAQAELIKAQKLIADQELVNLQAQKVLLDKQALEADQQLVHLVAQTAIVTEGLNTAIADTAIKDQQVLNLQNDLLKSNAEIALIEQNTTNAATNNDLMVEQISQTTAETALITQNTTNAATNNTLLLEQITQMTAETALVNQNTANALTSNGLITEQIDKTVAETSLINQNRTNAVTTNELIGNQSNKAAAETALLSQKRTTETAQTQNIAEPESLIGRQATLYQRQSDGFLRDAEQKATKMLLDTWNVRQTTGGALAGPAGISDASIKATVETLKNGIGTSSSGLNLSSAGATADSATTGTATVITETANGTLYYLVSELSTETSGAVINAANTQAVSAKGIQTIALTGLVTTMTYYVHFVHIDDAGIVSEVESSSPFVTP